MQTILNPLDGFFPALLRASWQAGALVLVVLAAQRLLARRLPPRWRHALWLIVLARLLLPVSVPSPASVFNFLHVPMAPGTRTESPPQFASGFAAGDRGAAAQPDFAAAPAVDVREPFANDANPPSLEPVVTASTAAAPSAAPIGWRRVAAWLWLAGVVGFTAVLAVQTLGLARRLRQAVPIAEEPLLRLLEACRAEMGVRRPVGLCETAAVPSPALCGVFRPRLLLPRGLAGRLSQPELRHVLLHELAHLKRHDLALNWLATALQVLHWFNPLVWLAGARMRADRELACDALALETAGETEKQAYGETILRLLEGFTHTARLPGLVGILEDQRQLRRRILAIAGFRKPSRWSALAAVLVAGLAVVGLTDAQRGKSDSSPSPTSVAGSEARQSEDPVKGQPREELRWGTLTFEGQPLANMKVRLLLQDRAEGTDGATDEQGRLRIPLELCGRLVGVWCGKGYAEVNPGTLADGFHYELKPVGRIEGWLHFGDSAATNELLRLWPIPLEAPRQRLSTEMVQTWTDQTGHFVFPVVLPGRWQITRWVGDSDKGNQPLDAKRGTSSAFAGLGRLTWVGGFESLVDVRPGQTSRVDLGRDSRTVIGQVVSEQPERPFRWTIVSGSLGPDTNTRADRQPARQVETELEQADHQLRQYYLPEFAADGKFTIRAVPPGDFVLSLHYVAWPEAGSATRLPDEGWAGGAVHVPSAPAGHAEEPVDAGTFTVQPVNPRKTADIAPPTAGRTNVGAEAMLPALRTALGQKDRNDSAAGKNSDDRLWGTVLVDGKPVEGAYATYFGRRRSMGDQIRTDANGRLFVYPNPAAEKLIFWHESYQAALDAKALTNEFRVELQIPHGSVEGRLWRAQQPWPGKLLSLRRRLPPTMQPPPGPAGQTNRMFQISTVTDAEGRFTFKDVVLGAWVVRSGRVEWGEVEVHLGEVAQLDLGRQDWVITGRAVTDPPGREVNWTEAWITLRTDLNQPDVRFYAGEAEADGSFIVPRVTPGDYQLFIAPEGFPAAGPSALPMSLGSSGPVPVVVSINPAATNRVIDLGAVTVKMKKQLKIGDLAPPFEVKTFDGQPVRLADFQGKVVLLCFWWASPYSIDRQRLKDLTLLRQQYRKDDRLVILGVNLNPNAAEAEAVLAEEKWDWLQTRAADRAAFFRDEYELQSTPALLVIGPDGRVRARNYNVDGIRSALWSAVGGQRSRNPQGAILRCLVDGLSMEFTNMVKAYYTPKDGLGILSIGGDRWVFTSLSLHGPACRTGRFTLEDTPGLVLDYSKNGASSDSRSHYSARAGSTGVSVEVNVQEVGAVGERVTGTFSAVVTNDRHEKITLTDGYFSAIREEPISASGTPAPPR